MPFTYKTKVSNPSQRVNLKKSFYQLAFAWSEGPEQYCDYRLDGKREGQWVRIKQYANGTLYLEASTKALLAEIGQPAGFSLQGSSVIDVAPVQSGRLSLSGAYVGSDESGKGDYFGPLVVAGVYVTDTTRQALDVLGVCDSKQLGDARIAQLAAAIEAALPAEAMASLILMPDHYNQRYALLKAEGKNLNHLLAWGHGEVIGTLCQQASDCRQVVVDQFGAPHYMTSELKRRGITEARLMQTPRAEANTAVAAASILARWGFVQGLQALSDQIGLRLPPGAGDPVLRQARLLVRDQGKAVLSQVAKLHFKTTDQL